MKTLLLLLLVALAGCCTTKTEKAYDKGWWDGFDARDRIAL